MKGIYLELVIEIMLINTNDEDLVTIKVFIFVIFLNIENSVIFFIYLLFIFVK